MSGRILWRTICALEEIWPAAVAVKTVPVKPLATPLVMAAGVPPLKMRDVGW